MPPTDRKLQALRNLAERPGTAHEGEVARAMLERLTGRPYVPPAPPRVKKAPKKRAPAAKQPDYMTDPLKMAQEVRKRFPIGTRVYYSGPSFVMNSPGYVVGYESGGYRVLVDFEWADAVFIVTACCGVGWRLTKNPMAESTARKFYTKSATRPRKPEMQTDYADARKRYDEMMGKF